MAHASLLLHQAAKNPSGRALLPRGFALVALLAVPPLAWLGWLMTVALANPAALAWLVGQGG